MTCSFGGANYSEGSLICSNGRELKCSGGAWQETGYACTLLSEVNATEYIQISSDGRTITSVADGQNFLLPCVKFVVGAPYGKVRLFNECGGCKEAAISWSDGLIQHVQVGGFSAVDIPLRAQASQIVGERDC
jgi:hypothetical protein